MSLGEDVLESEMIKLYIDGQFILGSVEGVVSDAFDAVSKWNGISISETSTTEGAGFAFTVGPVVSVNPLVPEAVSHDPTTAGFPSSYAITFGSTIEISGSDYDLWVVFPQKDFNPLILCDNNVGKPEDCDSAELAGISCIFDHWIVIISGFTSIFADTKVTLNIHGVCNPGTINTELVIELVVVSKATGTYGPDLIG